MRRRPVAAALLTLLALGAVTCGQLVWTANTLLRDESNLARVVHGALVREPLRSEAAPDLATDLSEIAVEALQDDGGPVPTLAVQRQLHAVAVEVVAGPAFDAQLAPLTDAIASWIVSGREDEDIPPAAATVLWDAYVDRLTQTHPQVAQRLAALPTPAEIPEHLRDTAQESVPQAGPTQGLRESLRLLPLMLLVFYVGGAAAAAGAVHVGAGSGRVIAAAIALPAVATLLVWTASTGPGSWRFLVHAAAQAALPACAVTAAVAVAVLLLGSRRPMVVAAPPQ